MQARIVLTALAILALATACGGGSDAGASDGRDVVAAFYPLAYAAEQIGGRDVPCAT